MARSSGYSITVKATDEASPTLEKVNKALERMHAPAAKFNKEVAKFGELTGVSKLTEGIHELGRGTFEAFESMERLAAPLGVITGAASIGGLTALVTRWGELAEHTQTTADILTTSTEKLSRWQGAARLAGASADDMTGGLRGLNKALNEATYRGTNAQLFTSLGIKFGDLEHGARRAADVLPELAEKLKTLPPETRLRIESQLGIPEGLDKLLKLGTGGIDRLAEEAGKKGVGITAEMAERGVQLKESLDAAEVSALGLGNTISDKLAPPLTVITHSITEWTDKNRDWIAQGIADHVSSVGRAFGLLPPDIDKATQSLDKWRLAADVGVLAVVSRMLPGMKWLQGMIARLALRGAAGGLTLPLLLGGDTPGGADGSGSPFSQPGPMFPNMPWLHSSGPVNVPALPPPAPSFGNPNESQWPGVNYGLPRGLRNNNPLNLSYLPGQGASGSDGRFGIYPTMEAGVAAAERQLLAYQAGGLSTLRQMITRWAPPSENDTAGYVADVASWTGVNPDAAIDMRNPAIAAKVIAAMARRENGSAPSSGAIDAGVLQGIGILPGSGGATAGMRGGLGSSKVDVDITFRGLPAGASASVTTSGAATAAPPRIERSMAHVGGAS